MTTTHILLIAKKVCCCQFSLMCQPTIQYPVDPILEGSEGGTFCSKIGILWSNSNSCFPKVPFFKHLNEKFQHRIAKIHLVLIKLTFPNMYTRPGNKTPYIIYEGTRLGGAGVGGLSPQALYATHCIFIGCTGNEL